MLYARGQGTTVLPVVQFLPQQLLEPDLSFNHMSWSVKYCQVSPRTTPSLSTPPNKIKPLGEDTRTVAAPYLAPGCDEAEVVTFLCSQLVSWNSVCAEARRPLTTTKSRRRAAAKKGQGLLFPLIFSRRITNIQTRMLLGIARCPELGCVCAVPTNNLLYVNHHLSLSLSLSLVIPI